MLTVSYRAPVQTTSVTGAGVTMAVIDSGVLLDSPNASRLKTTRDFTTGLVESAGDRSAGSVRSWHACSGARGRRPGRRGRRGAPCLAREPARARRARRGHDEPRDQRHPVGGRPSRRVRHQHPEPLARPPAVRVGRHRSARAGGRSRRQGRHRRRLVGGEHRQEPGHGPGRLRRHLVARQRPVRAHGGCFQDLRDRNPHRRPGGGLTVRGGRPGSMGWPSQTSWLPAIDSWAMPPAPRRST